MTAVRTGHNGVVVAESPRYRLEVAADGMRATLTAPAGLRWATLRPLAALDRVDAPDETLAVSPPRVADDGAIVIERRSTIWDGARVTIVCSEDAVEIRTSVTGTGALSDVRLLALRSAIPGRPTGFLPSGTTLRTLFSPNPTEPPRLVRPAGETAFIGVSGDGEPGRGRWLFTPAPLFLALTAAEDVTDLAEPVAEGWLGVSVAAPVAELTFPQLAYEAADGGFSLRLDYDGHTGVDGEFEAPLVVLSPGISDPYAGLRLHRDDLVARGHAPVPERRDAPGWWSEPIFCGWGAQCHLARGGGRAPDFATQPNYDRFLELLEAEGVVPGIVVIDDKWQAAYGTCEPDQEKWPDLEGWIAERRERGQRVLLWWKAWDPEGLPPELCVRNADGVPVALDPGNPAARDALHEIVRRMLGAGGLAADGLKTDFTARTPSGRMLASHGPGWGIALLHELLATVYRAAKDAKPDALVITHTPNPAFVDVTDMIRLNDMLRADDESLLPVVGQMQYRAAVVRAACPELPIDTDDWAIPDLDTWRKYAAVKPSLGVPALYYASHLDATGEQLTAGDYDTLRRTWARWREVSRR